VVGIFVTGLSVARAEGLGTQTACLRGFNKTRRFVYSAVYPSVSFARNCRLPELAFEIQNLPVVHLLGEHLLLLTYGCGTIRPGATDGHVIRSPR
jgi:hypothetical protein